MTDFRISPGGIQFEPSLPIQVPAAVTKLLDRAEARRNPKAIAALKTEGRMLADAGTWLESTVTEKQDLISLALAGVCPLMPN